LTATWANIILLRAGSRLSFRRISWTINHDSRVSGDNRSIPHHQTQHVLCPTAGPTQAVYHVGGPLPPTSRCHARLPASRLTSRLLPSGHLSPSTHLLPDCGIKLVIHLMALRKQGPCHRHRCEAAHTSRCQVSYGFQDWPQGCHPIPTTCK
jgi:hypothetical protein